MSAANAAAGYTGSAALDPNLVKAMIFQESQMGTSGTYLVAQGGPVMTRFNIGQTVDSSAAQLLLLMEREHPALLSRYHLTRIRADLAKAMRRKATLERKRARTAAEQAELQALRQASSQYWEDYLWTYRAPGKAVGFAHAVAHLFRSPGRGQPPRNLDYRFWIHLMVMWLFEKRRSVATWPEAIRAYNGAGPNARRYRDQVLARNARAASAASQGKDFIPDKI